MTYVLIQNPNITHDDQELNGLSFENIHGDYWSVTGTDQTVVDAWVTREAATVIDPETDTNFLTLAREAKKQEFNDRLKQELKIIRDENTQEEIDTFVIQENEARAYVADNTVSTPFIDTIALERGIARTDLINKVIVAADNYRALTSTMLGKKQKAFDSVDAALTWTDIKAVTWI